ncbi:YozE family protein [Micromonospora sp. SL1-18]|uniref:YozE family protein n=1 Tax=Micromonospora sp. SL1-18 TaxID=3399128 RepID=UPI003A4D8E49
MSDRTIAADDLAKVLEDHPKLSAEGYDHPDVRQPDKLVGSRDNLTRRLDEVQAAYDWITTLRRVRITRGTASSYGLKHEGERAGIRYVTNGAMIAAAYLAGVTVKVVPGDPNPKLGVTTARRKPKPVPGSFAAWLAGQVDHNDPVGDLARDAAEDDGWPVDGDYRVYYDYLNSVHAIDGAMRSLRTAWTAFSGSEPEDPYGDDE